MLLLHPPVPPWAVANEEGLDLVLLTDEPLPAGRVFVRSLPHNEELLTPMQPAPGYGALLAYRAHIAWDRGNRLTRYAFVVAADGAHHWLAADGVHAMVPDEAVHFRFHPTEQPPLWVREQVFYQVFPDRFARGPHHTGAGFSPWGEPPDPARAGTQRFGGDLPGVIDKLPYLQDELGASAIYLNPVFTSPSNHRYDTSDYLSVDPALGGNAALQTLRETTRARGMRLVLDAVFNHTGVQHPWVQHHPERYAHDAAGRIVGWKGHASLPVLDFAQAAVRAAIYEAEDAVVRHWLRPPYAIDGWRLDVIHMLGEGAGAWRNLAHCEAIRAAIRGENASAYVLGEHFAEATRWLQGSPEDGAMNYHGFTTPVRGWLAGLEVGGTRVRLSTTHFAHALARAIARVPHANQLAQMNLLDSHDTPRLTTELGGDLDLARVAATLLFTRPGVPCIYAGDEIGLPGAADPDNRRCFDWNRAHWPMPLWQHYAQLARLRRTRRDWIEGATVPLAHGTDWIAYARCTADEATLVLANRGDAAAELSIDTRRLPLHTRAWADALPGDAGPAPLPIHPTASSLVALRAAPRSARVLLSV